MNDTLQRFIFEATPIRGELVHLDATWQAILQRHDYPPRVRDLLGEMMAAAILLAATLKMHGRLIIQIQGQGPIRLMVVECTNALELRGLAHWQDLPDSSDLELLLVDGRLIITLEPNDEPERYQSIVELKGKTLSAVLGSYLQQSEQLDTHIWLAANGERAAGLLLQKLPSKDPGRDSDAWNRIIHLSQTVQTHELLELSHLDILHRLYHEEQVRVFEPSPVCFRCSCSKERVVNMLRVLGYAEVRSIVQEQGCVNVACEFCNQKYDFDSVDVEQLFASSEQHQAPRARQ
ncbi:MAG: Hsp33 family molecular chaperone HslO [Gammaproteobacteria bacterium]|nr:Hsp33 family molecular chaperone HslO [Gammaproteobacteria bacterium]